MSHIVSDRFFLPLSFAPNALKSDIHHLGMTIYLSAFMKSYMILSFTIDGMEYLLSLPLLELRMEKKDADSKSTPDDTILNESETVVNSSSSLNISINKNGSRYKIQLPQQTHCNQDI